MGLSFFDQQYLNDADKTAVLNLQAEAQRIKAAGGTDYSGVNNAANAIRGKYGYSGGVDGSGYVKTGAVIPQVKPYASKYGDMIDSTLSKITNYGSFNYDPNDDESYQTYLAKATAMGNTAYDNNLAGMSAATGGRLNSWAGSVASQARDKYMSEASYAMADFEQNAYTRWNAGKQDLFTMLDAYSGLEDRDYGRYQDGLNIAWKNYEYETEQYKSALAEKQTAISNAYDRTKLRGFVSNEDAITLGVEPGTPSYEVQERKASMDEWIKQQEYQLDHLGKELSIRKQYASSGGSGSSGKSGAQDMSSGERTKVNTLINNYAKSFTNNAAFKARYKKEGKETVFDRQTTVEERAGYMQRYIDTLESKYSAGALTDKEFEAILGYVYTQPEYQEYEQYASNQNKNTARHDIPE